MKASDVLNDPALRSRLIGRGPTKPARRAKWEYDTLVWAARRQRHMDYLELFGAKAEAAAILFPIERYRHAYRR